MRLLATFVSLACIAVCLWACGSDSQRAPTVDEVPDVFSNRFCQSLFACQSTPSVEACVETFDNSYYLQVIRLIGEGRIVYNGGRADQCLDLLAGDACQERNQNAVDELFTICKMGFGGTAAPGEACLVNEECTGGLCEFTDCADICCQGICAHDFGTGQDCSEIPCAYNAWCDPADNTCRALAGAFQDCSAAPCESGTVCDATTGVCVAAGGLGEACVPSLGAISCRRFDNYCEATTQLCAARVGVGQECEEGTNDPCVLYAVCVGGTCQALPVLDESCGPGNPCLGDAVCDAGICVAPEPTNCAE